MPPQKSARKKSPSKPPKSFEESLWETATKLRGSVESSDWSGATKTTRIGCPEGERGGVHQFYTPKCVVNLIAEMIEPYKGKIYDPCCGSGGMFVQSLKFVERHHGNTKDITGGLRTSKT